MNLRARNKGIAAIFTAAVVAALFMGGIGGYAVAKAEGSGSGSPQQAIALRWDHEERTLDSTTARASRWDHEERAALDSITRASRWDHEER